VSAILTQRVPSHGDCHAGVPPTRPGHGPRRPPYGRRRVGEV